MDVDLDENLIVEVDRELMNKNIDLEDVNITNSIDAYGRLGAILQDGITVSMW